MFQKLLRWLRAQIGTLFGDAPGANDIILSGQMENAIALWAQMYETGGPWCTAKNDLHSLHIAASVAREFARLVTMELEVSLSGSPRADYLAEQLAPFLDKLPNYTELACALGGAVFKPYVSGDRLLVDVVQGDCFFPTTFDTTGRLTGAIFSEQLKRKNTIYTRLERHEYTAGVQTIQNKAFASSSTASLGQEIPLADVPEWADITPEMRIEVERPLFAYFRIPLANRNDRHSPLGASVYAPAVDTIHDADEQFGRLLWEYEGGERYEDFETATGYGTGPGLCGWNCRHNFYPFYPGISVRNYTDKRLAELDARNIPYGGGLYTKYEITQMQRALERKVRRYKRRYLAETAAGVDASQSAAKLKIARQQLSAFLTETGERLDGARAEVPGFGQREAKQADADQKRYTTPAASGILDPSNRIGVNPDVNYICDLNPEIYKAAVPTITTEHVIITDKQLEHIRERHPDISATVMEQLTEIIHAPDYIIETDMPYTANILKHLEINGKGYQLVLRIRTDSDPEEFQNSVITFMSVNEKRYRQYLRNRKILYSRE